jgi:hypothetical protein
MFTEGGATVAMPVDDGAIGVLMRSGGAWKSDAREVVDGYRGGERVGEQQVCQGGRFGVRCEQGDECPVSGAVSLAVRGDGVRPGGDGFPDMRQETGTGGHATTAPAARGGTSL